jgi:hypothetical protein
MLIHKGLRPHLQRSVIRGMATHARSTLKVALLPADGIGREVIPVRMLHSLGVTYYPHAVLICAHDYDHI